MGWSRSWLLAAVLVAVLVPWQQQRLVASQGLNVPPATLGAGALATATEFEVFEDVLSLALTTTGGRGRGGRGGASNLGGGNFKSATEFEQLQTAMYYVGGSPKQFNALESKDWQGFRLRPPVREQGVICHSCVGQALASAIQLSLAFNLREWKTERPVEEVYDKLVNTRTNADGSTSLSYDVDARTLYYCAAGGRSCETGWDIPDALEAVFEDSENDDVLGSNKPGKWMKPAFCLDEGIKARDFIDKEAENVLWEKVCQDAAVIRPQGEDASSKQNETALRPCWDITQNPIYECDYTSLSNFWQIQRWIRLHGSVITRIQVQDDFDVFLNDTAAKYNGSEWKVYDKNVSAKLDFGHAALIVGYDNENFTWTILNSWGTSKDNDRPRGFTKDGTFRVRMGLLGIGTPDATYGVRCYPRNGSMLDPKGLRRWKKNARDSLGMRKKEDIPHTEQGCPFVGTNFTRDRFDVGITGFVDFKGLIDFNPRIIEFVQYNYINLGYNVAEFSYKFPYRLNNRTMHKMWEVVFNQTRFVMFKEANKTVPHKRTLPHAHYFECFYYSSDGEPAGPFHCPPWYDNSDALDDYNQPRYKPTFDQFDLCTRNGTVECTLRYWDVNVTEEVAEGLELIQPLCGADLDDVVTPTPVVPNLPPEAQAESTAMSNILDEIDQQWRNGADTTGTRGRARSSSAPAAATPVNFTKWLVCPDGGGAINRTMTTPNGRNIAWIVACETTGGVRRVTSLYFRVDADVFTMQPTLSARMQANIGSLVKLRSLDIRVYDGEFTTDLNALNELQKLNIYHICMTSALPELWFTSWDRIRVLRITKDAAAYFYAPANTNPRLECGVIGAIPASWDNRYYPNLALVDLSHNRLSGSLPADLIRQWPSLTELQLQQNQLTGPIPAEWAQWPQTPEHTGPVTFEFSSNNFRFAFPQSWSAFEGKLAGIKLDHNAALTGCVPITDVNATISAVGTSMYSSDGRCFNTSSLQYQALNASLNSVLGATSKRAAGGARQSDGINMMLNALTEKVRNLGNMVPRGSTSISVTSSNGAAFAELEVTRIRNGVESITAISARNVALDLTHFTKLVKDLPDLRSFTCESCNRSGPGSQRKLSLLAALPAAAANLTKLALPSCKLTGKLPPEWCSWSSLSSMNLANNNLAGKLPTRYGNPSIPECSPFMDRALVMTLPGNRGLSGNVPTTYSWFSSTGKVQLDVRGSRVGGCCPDALRMLPSLPYCYQQVNGTGSSVLKSLKAVLQSNSGTSAALDEWDVNNAITPDQQDPVNGPYRYCKWTGIICQPEELPPADGIIIGLDLAALGISYPAAGPTLSAIVNSILPLSELQSLILSNMKLAGTIPAALAGFEMLESLDLSLNPGLVGTLPEILGGLTSLKTLDISYCSGLTGSLPDLFSAMAALQSFNAANCSGLEGSIPPSWVLLKNLQSLKISSSKVNGTLPDWTNATTLRKATYTAKRAADTIRLSKATKRSAGPVALTKAARRAVSALSSSAAAGDVVGWSKLEVLLLSDNALEGTVPASYSTLLSLTLLDLSGNGMLSGPLPSLGKLELLKELDLAGNAFTGSLPPSYNQLTQLTTLNLASNNITGQLPGQWVSLKALQLMDISANNMTGAVPTIWQAFGGVTYQLQCLVLHSNPELNKAFPGAPASIKNNLKIIASPGDTC